MVEISETVQQFWQDYCHDQNAANAELYDVFKVGSTPESADEGAKLVLEGRKTATSALPEEFKGKRLPFVGALSVLLDGTDRPRAVVKTTAVQTRPFGEADEAFARQYGEWDMTLRTWIDRNTRYYSKLCDDLNLEWSKRRPLIFEWFEVVFPTASSRIKQAGGT